MQVPGFKKPNLGTRDKRLGSIQNVELDQGLCDQPGIPQMPTSFMSKTEMRILAQIGLGLGWRWGRESPTDLQTLKIWGRSPKPYILSGFNLEVFLSTRKYNSFLEEHTLNQPLKESHG